MRIIHKFRYKNKLFQAGELTVGDYLIFLEDFDYFVEKILSDFNEKPPVLGKEYLWVFLNIIFWVKEDADIFRKNKKDNSKDFHIMIAMLMRDPISQPFGDICMMPMRIFNKFLEDYEIIIDPSKYDPKRNDTEVDRSGIKKQFGDKKEIKW